MLLSLRGLLLPAVLITGLCLILPAAEAQGPPDGFRIRDGGKFFSKETLDRAEGVIRTIKRETKKDVFIETYAAIPEGLRARYEKEGKEKFFSAWARHRAEEERVEGVAILICRDPEYLVVETDRRTEMQAFTGPERREVRNILIDFFKKGEFDKGLTAALGYIKGKLETNAATTGGGAAPRTRTGAASQGTAEKKEGIMGDGILGWVCLGVLVLFGLWLIFGLIRAFTGAGRPVERPGGYAPGGYRPGGGYGPAPAGGGGGGFMSSLLGGMLGAGAGMWAYDTFFRGGSSGGGMTPPAYGGGTPVGGSEPQPGGTDGGSWGGSAPAGDTGGDVGGDWGGGDEATGGDWGGGDDVGGDWGGGGGDAGGDWGGGGGDAGGDW